MSEVKTVSIDLHPACRPVPVGRVRGVGVGGKLWALKIGGGSAAAGESRLSVGVSSRAAEDQDLERRAQLGGKEAEGSRGPKLCNAVADSCNVLGAWHLSAHAPTCTSLWCACVPPQASRAGARALHATSSFGVLDVPRFQSPYKRGGNCVC